MKGLVVTSTGCNTQKKKDIQEKVQCMCGVYTPALSGNVTHLIMKSVADFSPKFKVVVFNDLHIMVPSYVDARLEAANKVLMVRIPFLQSLLAPLFLDWSCVSPRFHQKSVNCSERLLKTMVVTSLVD